MARTDRIPPSVAYVLYIAVFGAVILAGNVQTTFCKPCDISLCKRTLNCVNGVVLDSCNCCQVCARQINETCGGPKDVFGKCGDNLTCYLSLTIGQQITGNEPGTCKANPPTTPNQCESISCFTPDNLSCPFDSSHEPINDPTTIACCPHPPVECVCNPALCPVNAVCLVGFIPELVHPATGVPGQCCNITKCHISEKCASVICLQQYMDEELCPSDSYRPQSVISEDGCCEIKQRCKCIKDKCPPSQCDTGLKVQILLEGNGIPGSCCDTYKCVNDSELMCNSDGKQYRNGETWIINNCTHCTCKSGLKICQVETCPMLTCGWGKVPDGGCCPICQGCVQSNRLYNNSDTWQENECTHCICQSGQASCVSQTCQIKCVKPRYESGRCCPICDNPAQSEQPMHCDEDSKCQLVCPAGRRIDAHGCEICGCKADKCSLRCKQGLVVDTDGNEVCRCNKPAHICQPLTGCNKNCIYGFRQSRFGCSKCRCNKCPMFHCTKKCNHGYVTNDKSCEICKCRDPNTPVVESLPPQDRACLSDSGLLHEDGESWHDGCRRCFCHNGKEMCYLIRCSPLSCPNPVFRLGDCCPSCPGALSTATQHRPLMEQCRTVDGAHFTEGETWNLDKCTECICHEGLILCETKVCLPLLCHYPVRRASQCCPICQPTNSVPRLASLKPQSCFTSGRESYKHGAVWRVNPCQSCTCREGLIHCYSQMCPPLKCRHTTLLKGYCCPTCIDDNKSVPCEADGETYSVGEKWQQQCSLCVCAEGGMIKCVNVSCPLHKCFVLVRKPGTCCPICLEDSGFSMAHARIYPHHTHTVGPPHTQLPSHSAAHEQLVTIAILSVLFMVVLLILIVIIARYMWRRRTGRFRAAANIDGINVLTDFKSRPMSDNSDLNGTTPFLHNIKSFSKYENCPLSDKQEQFSELLSSGDKWTDSTTNTSLSSTA